MVVSVLTERSTQIRGHIYGVGQYTIVCLYGDLARVQVNVPMG